MGLSSRTHAKPFLVFFLLAASVVVAEKEAWRRTAIQRRVNEFRALTGIPVESHIISLVVGSEEKALQASRSNSLYQHHCILALWSLYPYIFIFMKQASSGIRFSHNCNQTSNSSSKLLQVCHTCMPLNFFVVILNIAFVDCLVYPIVQMNLVVPWCICAVWQWFGFGHIIYLLYNMPVTFSATSFE